jgi:hypothetical protein
MPQTAIFSTRPSVKWSTVSSAPAIIHRSLSRAVNYITCHGTEGFQKVSLPLPQTSSAKPSLPSHYSSALSASPGSLLVKNSATGWTRPVSEKETDPVNQERKAQDCGTRIFNCVASLVTFQKLCSALGEDDTEFFHRDFTQD